MIVAAIGAAGLIVLGVGIALNNGRICFAGIGLCLLALLWGDVSQL